MPSKLPQFHETALFQRWMREQGHTWPEAPDDQQALVQRFWEEGMDAARREIERTWTGTEEKNGGA